jgi:2-polyprenyl-3-methyl-5-hydroxy-6-metoxy-1,4-benzoquinol methylase
MSRPEKIESYIIPFVQRLKTIDPAGLPGLDSYCKTYLQHLLLHSRYYTAIYAQLLTALLTNSKQEKSSIVLVDYGAGNGLLGMFAKFCGFKKVYINDISESFTKAAAQLSAMLQLTADGFITGDIDDLAAFFANKEKPDAIVGTDVIEHIYNLDHFFGAIQMMNPDMVTVLSTAANTGNWLKARNIKKQQVADEYKGGAPDENELFGERPMESFFKQRSSIIKSTNPSLSKEEVVKLATATRGLIKAGIEHAVRQYTFDKKMPLPCPHPTNTCDPVTGSWAERLLTMEEYKVIYRKAGFDCYYSNGFYNSYENNLKSTLLKLANLFVKITGKYFAPFIILTGRKRII